MSKELQLGIFFIIALVIIGFFFELLGGIPFFQDYYTLKTHFTDIAQLREGNPVKLSGFEVGTISNLDVGDDRIVVKMHIFGDEPIKKDSVATIRLTSLLGISYVNLSFGSPTAPPAQDGDVLESEEPPNMDALLKDLEKTTESLKVVIVENQENISGILKGLDTIVTDASEGKGTVGRLLKDDSLYVEMRDTFANVKDISQSIREGKGTLGRLAKDESLYEETRESFVKLGDFFEAMQSEEGTIGKLIKDDKLYDQAAEAATNLNDILKKVKKGEGTLGKLVNDDTLYDNAQNATKKLQKTIDTQEDLSPLQTLGTAFGIITIF